MILEFALGAPLCPDPEFRPNILIKVHYLYFAMLLFGISILIAIAVTLVTPPINKRCVSRLNFFSAPFATCYLKNL